MLTTSNSYKGYESEVIIIPGVDQFVTGKGEILANNLYVAMTRARSLLAIYGTRNGSSSARQIFETLNSCTDLLKTKADVASETSRLDAFNNLLEQIGVEHRNWLKQLWTRFDIKQEPIFDEAGNVLAQPLFWFNDGELRYLVLRDSNDATTTSIPNAVLLKVGEPIPAS